MCFYQSSHILFLKKVQKSWFSNPNTEVAAMLVEILKTGPAIFFLNPLCFLYVAHRYFIADKFCIFFLSLKYMFCNQPLEGNIRQLISWISGARATRFLILFGF